MSDDSSASPATDLRTFLIADVRGYTRFTQDSGDEAASALTARFAGIVRIVMPGFGGELLELRGDEALCVFSSARQALRASVELQRRLREPAEGEQPFPLGVGIGLDAGEAVPTEGGYRGAALNLAARLCAIAKPGQILATERLVGLTGPVEGLHPTNVRSERLGIPQPERLVTIEPDRPIAPPPPAPAPPAPPGQHQIALGLAAGVVIALAIVAGVVYQISQATARPAVVAVKPNSLAVIDPGVRDPKNAVVDDVPLGATPESMTTGYGKVWIGNQGGTVSDVAISRPATPATGGVTIAPAGVATGDGAVWGFDGQSRIAEIDPNGSLIEGPYRLWRCTASTCGGAGVTVVGSQVWVGQARNGFYEAPNGIIHRLDSDNLKTQGTIPGVIVGPLSNTPDGVWSAGNAEGLQFDHVDPATADVNRQKVGSPAVATFTSHPTQAVSGFAFTWVATAGGVLYRLSSDAPYQTFQVPAGIVSLAVSNAGIWMASSSGKVYLFSPSRGGIVRMYSLGNTRPVAVVSAGGRIWVAVT